MSEISPEELAVPVRLDGNRLAALEAENAALQEKTEQFLKALDTRIVTEQAKDAVSARLGTTPEVAFEMMSGLARSQRRDLHEFAAKIVASGGRLDT